MAISSTLVIIFWIFAIIGGLFLLDIPQSVYLYFRNRKVKKQLDGLKKGD